MKKMLRIAAALAALLAMTNFIGCKNDDDDDGDVAVTEVKITSTVKEVTAGETIILKAEVLPADATNKTVTWTSSDATVATVKDGVVTGVKAGEATITASAGGKNATVKVTVKAAATGGGETGGETGGSTGGTTGGETGGSTGGTTGGETGGSTGGETGTTTGFENTYWVVKEEVSEFSGIKLTLQNFMYTYIKDSTSGFIYVPDTDKAMEELVKTGGGTKKIAYGEVTGDAFTYTVEGKNITITATIKGETKDETKTLTGTIVDENTLRFTDNSDGEPSEYTLKKAAAAPTEATVTVEITAAPSETHTLDANSITQFNAGAKTDGAEEALDDYFTAIWSTKSKVDASSKAFGDGYTGTQRINFGGKMLKDKNAIKFTTKKAATVKIWWVQGGDNNRKIGIASATDYSGTDQNTVVATNETLAKNEACISTLELSDAGTWILGGVENNNYIFKIEVTE